MSHEILNIYDEWMRKNVPEDTYGKCREVTEHMAEAFPELIRVRGHYYCVIWGEREHWWLKTDDGTIIDPTADQFPTRGAGEYVELDESLPEPTGICLECGEYCFDGRYFCCDFHERSYIAYLNSGC